MLIEIWLRHGLFNLGRKDISVEELGMNYIDYLLMSSYNALVAAKRESKSNALSLYR